MQTSFNLCAVVLTQDTEEQPNTDQIIEFFKFNNIAVMVIPFNRLYSYISVFQQMNFDYILTVDGSENKPCEWFTSMLEQINDAQTVVGVRLGNSWVSKFFNLLFPNFSMYQDWLSANRLYRVEVLQTLLDTDSFAFEDNYDRYQAYLLAKASELGCIVKEVAIPWEYKPTSMTIKEVVKMWWWMATSTKKDPSVNESYLY